jgi:thymidylate kinase
MPEPMDGPKLTEDDLKYFYNKERVIYDSINNYPDIMLILDIDLDTSIKRKPEHSKIAKRLKEKEIAIKSLIKNVNGQENICIIDASKPQDEVMRIIKKFVWDRL